MKKDLSHNSDKKEYKFPEETKNTLPSLRDSEENGIKNKEPQENLNYRQKGVFDVLAGLIFFILAICLISFLTMSYVHETWYPAITNATTLISGLITLYSAWLLKKNPKNG